MVTMTEHHPKTQGDDAGVPDLTEHLDRSWYRVGVGANRVEDVLGLTAMRGGAGARCISMILLSMQVYCVQVCHKLLLLCSAICTPVCRCRARTDRSIRRPPQAPQKVYGCKLAPFS
jgi:hypothetical protein